MFGFVSRKEFEEYKNEQQWLANKRSETLARLETALENRIAKLEAVNNCRDGKHEWVETGEIKNLGNGIFTNVAFTACEHCGVNWQSFDDKMAKQVQEKRMDKPQPKRKKGKPK